MGYSQAVPIDSCPNKEERLATEYKNLKANEKFLKGTEAIAKQFGLYALSELKVHHAIGYAIVSADENKAVIAQLEKELNKKGKK